MKKTVLSEAIAARMNVLAGIPLVEDGGPERSAFAADYEEENLGDGVWNNSSDEDLSDTGLDAQGMHEFEIDPETHCQQCGEEYGLCACDDLDPFDASSLEPLDIEDDVIDYVDSSDPDGSYGRSPGTVTLGNSVSLKKESKIIRITESQLRSLVKAIRG